MRRWIAVALALPALWLAWQIVALGQAQTETELAPQAALRWRANFAPALSNAAELTAIDAFSSGQLARSADLARRALLASPLEAKALRILGIVAVRTHNEAQATRLMTLTAARTQRDPIPHLWLFQREVARGDWGPAMSEADTLMRKPPANYDVPSIVIAAARQPAARQALADRMRLRPPWGDSLVTQMVRRDPNTAFDLLSLLAQNGSPPTDAQVGALMRQMLSDGAVLNAYLAWTVLLPRSALERLGDVYDPEFEGLPGAPPFNWTLGSGGDFGAQLAPGPNGAGSALYIHYSAKKPAVLASQILLLPPGRYQLVARTYLEQSDRSDDLGWSLACYGGPPLAQIAAPGDGLVWSEASATLEVPANGCDAQSLVLTGHPGERLGEELRGWVDRVEIRRASGG